MSNILVTGNAGFMGSWLVDELAKKGHTVIGIDDLSGGFEENVTDSCAKFYKIDIRNRMALQEVFRNNDIDIIYHLAAYAAEGQSVFSPIAINDINITSMNNLLVEAVNRGVKRFVFTSSMAVYGKGWIIKELGPPFDEACPRYPEDPYGAGKAYCEKMLEMFYDLHGLEYCIIRPHNVYGPRQNIADPYRNVIGIWMNRLMRNRMPIIYGDGKQTRAFSYIEDITPPLARAGFLREAKNEIINLGGDEVVNINTACGTVLGVAMSKKKPKYVATRKGEVKDAYCTIEKSKKILRYKTRHDLVDGVTKMWKWAKQVGPQKPTYRLPLEIRKEAPRIWLKQEM